MKSLDRGVMMDVGRRLAADRENLYSLADQVLTAAPQRGWDVAVTDGCSGHYVARFLGRLLRERAQPDLPPPRQIAVANSRFVGSSIRHARAVHEFLDGQSLRHTRVLAITEYVSRGRALRRLSQHLLDAGASVVDAAVLSADKARCWPTWDAIAPDELYLGEPNHGEPKMYAPTISKSSGLRTVIGDAEPQPDESVDSHLVRYLGGVFDSLATEYLAAR